MGLNLHYTKVIWSMQLFKKACTFLTWVTKNLYTKPNVLKVACVHVVENYCITRSSRECLLGTINTRCSTWLHSSCNQLPTLLTSQIHNRGTRVRTHRQLTSHNLIGSARAEITDVCPHNVFSNSSTNALLTFNLLLAAALLRLLTGLTLDAFEAHEAKSLGGLLFRLGTALEIGTHSAVCQGNGALLKICFGGRLDAAASAEVVCLEVTHVDGTCEQALLKQRVALKLG